MNAFNYVGLFLVTTLNLLHAENWGGNRFFDIVIEDYSHDTQRFLLKDGRVISIAEMYAVTLPNTLTSSEGKTIDCKNLGFDARTGRLVFESTLGGTKDRTEYMLPLARFDQKTQQMLSTYLIEIKDNLGRSKMGLILEVSPGGNEIAFSPDIKNVFSEETKGYRNERFVYHIQTEKLDANSKHIVEILHKSRFGKLVDIARLIESKKTKHFQHLHETNPINPDEEQRKVFESQQVRALAEQKYQIYRSRVQAWENQVSLVKSQIRTASASVDLQIDSVQNQLNSLSDQWRNLMGQVNTWDRLKVKGMSHSHTVVNGVFINSSQCLSCQQEQRERDNAMRMATSLRSQIKNNEAQRRSLEVQRGNLYREQSQIASRFTIPPRPPRELHQIPPEYKPRPPWSEVSARHARNFHELNEQAGDMNLFKNGNAFRGLSLAKHTPSSKPKLDTETNNTSNEPNKVTRPRYENNLLNNKKITIGN